MGAYSSTYISSFIKKNIHINQDQIIPFLEKNKLDVNGQYSIENNDNTLLMEIALFDALQIVKILIPKYEKHYYNNNKNENLYTILVSMYPNLDITEFYNYFKFQGEEKLLTIQKISLVNFYSGIKSSIDNNTNLTRVLYNILKHNDNIYNATCIVNDITKPNNVVYCNSEEAICDIIKNGIFDPFYSPHNEPSLFSLIIENTNQSINFINEYISKGYPVRAYESSDMHTFQEFVLRTLFNKPFDKKYIDVFLSFLIQQKEIISINTLSKYASILVSNDYLTHERSNAILTLVSLKGIKSNVVLEYALKKLELEKVEKAEKKNSYTSDFIDIVSATIAYRTRSNIVLPYIDINLELISNNNDLFSYIRMYHGNFKTTQQPIYDYFYDQYILTQHDYCLVLINNNMELAQNKIKKNLQICTDIIIDPTFHKFVANTVNGTSHSLIEYYILYGDNINYINATMKIHSLNLQNINLQFIISACYNINKLYKMSNGCTNSMKFLEIYEHFANFINKFYSKNIPRSKIVKAVYRNILTNICRIIMDTKSENNNEPYAKMIIKTMSQFIRVYSCDIDEYLNYICWGDNVSCYDKIILKNLHVIINDIKYFNIYSIKNEAVNIIIHLLSENDIALSIKNNLVHDLKSFIEAYDAPCDVKNVRNFMIIYEIVSKNNDMETLSKLIHSDNNTARVIKAISSYAIKYSYIPFSLVKKAFTLDTKYGIDVIMYFMHHIDNLTLTDEMAQFVEDNAYAISTNSPIWYEFGIDISNITITKNSIETCKSYAIYAFEYINEKDVSLHKNYIEICNVIIDSFSNYSDFDSTECISIINNSIKSNNINAIKKLLVSEQFIPHFENINMLKYVFYTNKLSSHTHVHMRHVDNELADLLKKSIDINKQIIKFYKRTFGTSNTSVYNASKYINEIIQHIDSNTSEGIISICHILASSKVLPEACEYILDNIKLNTTIRNAVFINFANMLDDPIVHKFTDLELNDVIIDTPYTVETSYFLTSAYRNSFYTNTKVTKIIFDICHDCINVFESNESIVVSPFAQLIIDNDIILINKYIIDDKFNLFNEIVYETENILSMGLKSNNITILLYAIEKLPFELFNKDIPYYENNNIISHFLKSDKFCDDLLTKILDKDLIDPDYLDQNNNNYFMIACAHNKSEFASKMFDKYSFDLLKINKENMTAYDYAFKNKYNDIIKLYTDNYHETISQALKPKSTTKFEPECIICLDSEDCERYMLPKCGHVILYHFKCMKGCMTNHGSSIQCPMCRKKSTNPIKCFIVDSVV